MTQGDAMIQEMARTRTIACDALSDRCVVLQAEKFDLQQKLAAAANLLAEAQKEIENLKAQVAAKPAEE